MPQVETGMYANATPINLSNFTQNYQAAQLQQQQADAAAQQKQMNALKLSEMGRAEKVAQDDSLFKQGVQGAASVDPVTGKVSIDQGKLSDIGKQFPMQYLAYQQAKVAQDHTMKLQQLEDLRGELKMHGQLVGGATPSNWNSTRLNLIKVGHYDPSEVPESYDQEWVKGEMAKSMDADKLAETKISQQKADADTKNADTKAGELPIRQKEADAKIQENHIRDAERKDAKGNTQLQQVQSMLESARGNPEVMQAQKDMLAAQKLKSLIPPGSDPDKVSPQKFALAVSEVGKMATGGVPTTHELQDLNPATLSGGLATAWQKLTNAPTPANKGEFLKEYMDYANEIDKTAKSVVHEKYSRVLDSRRKSIGEDNYSTLHANYVKPLEDSGTPASGGFKMPSTSDIDAEIARRSK